MKFPSCAGINGEDYFGNAMTVQIIVLPPSRSWLDDFQGPRNMAKLIAVEKKERNRNCFNRALAENLACE